MADSDELYPIAVLIEELKDEDLQTRLSSVQRLSTIALALGEQTTRDELLPFLTTALQDEDEILLAIAEQLATFSPLVGGKDYVHTIFPPLEALAATDETVVREKALEAFKSLIAEQAPNQASKHLIPVANRLAEGDTFAAKASACTLYASAFSKISDDQREDVLKRFGALCRDDTPIVRRNAAANVGTIVEAASADTARQTLLPLVRTLLGDDQDTVRLLSVGALVHFAKLLPHEEFVGEVLPLYTGAAQDRSWRVRNAVAENFRDLQKVLQTPAIKAEAVPAMIRLLKDPEPEVRTQACLQLPVVGETLSQDDRKLVLMTNVVPVLTNMCADTSQHVRIALASKVVSLAPSVGKKEALEHIVPMCIQLLKDEVPEVRLNIISDLESLQTVIGVDQVSKTIIPEIVSLAEDPQWRVRLAIIEQLPALAKSLGPQVFDEKLTPLMMTWLTDSVYAIREAVARHLCDLVEVFGLEWCASSIAPKIVVLGSEGQYLARLTSLITINAMVKVINTDIASKAFFPVVKKLAADDVPNIRFNVAKTLESLLPKLDANLIKSEAQPLLEKLKADDDMDVQFFADKALKACN